MDGFLLLIEEELRRQLRLLKESKRVLKGAPDGLLRCRVRKKGISYYMYTREGCKRTCDYRQSCDDTKINTEANC